MLIGTITNRRAHLELYVRGAGGHGKVEFTIDTGFTALLTMPPAYWAALKLDFLRKEQTFLADGSIIWTDVHSVIVEWDGEEREVESISVECDPLIGMTMLDGYDVFMSVKENGIIHIRKSPP